MKRRVLYWSAVMLLVAASGTRAKPLEAMKNFARFDCIRLGMSVADLTRCRPTVKPFGFFQTDKTVDARKQDQMLFETLSHHALFETVYYRFRGIELDVVVFAGTLRGTDMEETVHQFLDRVISLWGRADESLVVGIDDPEGAAEGAPALLWQKSNAIIVAAHTAQ